MEKLALDHLRQDLARQGKVGLRNAPSNKLLFGVERVDILFVQYADGVRTYITGTSGNVAEQAQFGLRAASTSGWTLVRQGPFKDLEVGVECVTRFLQTADLREPMSREEAWHHWGDIWLAVVSGVISGAEDLSLHTERVGDAVRLKLFLDGEAHNLTSVIDQAIGLVSDSNSTLLIRAIASEPELFALSFSQTIDELRNKPSGACAHA